MSKPSMKDDLKALNYALNELDTAAGYVRAAKAQLQGDACSYALGWGGDALKRLAARIEKQTREVKRLKAENKRLANYDTSALETLTAELGVAQRERDEAKAATQRALDYGNRESREFTAFAQRVDEELGRGDLKITDRTYLGSLDAIAALRAENKRLRETVQHREGCTACATAYAHGAVWGCDEQWALITAALRNAHE